MRVEWFESPSKGRVGYNVEEKSNELILTEVAGEEEPRVIIL